MILSFYEYINEAVLNKPVLHTLSGIVLIYNNKILLVRPKKFVRNARKFSIPKGHIERKMSKIETALKELREESSIKLKKKYVKGSEKTILNYFKAGAEKHLTCYVVKISKNEMNVRLFNDMILSHFLKSETIEAGFFSKKDAEKIIERNQLGLLKFLD